MTPQRLQPVRVLFLDHVPRMSGAEQSLADLVIGLKAGPVEPVVVLPNDGPLAHELRAHGVLVRMVPMSKRMLETSRATLGRSPLVAFARAFSFLAASFRVWRIIREVRPNIVHTNTLKSHLIAIIPALLGRVPLVWHMRDILPRGWVLRALMFCARFASVVIVPSRAVAEPFRGRRRLLRKLRLIPNGVRVEDFVDARHDRSLREMMAVGPNDPVIGIVGRIAPWKGQDVFLRTAAMLAKRHPRAHFAIIGAVLFPENDLPFERHLHRMVMSLGLEDRVTFVGWQPAPEAMAAIDVMVHASSEPEPFGRVIVEAMAAGKPVVASAGGAVTEIVPPAAGFLVPPGRPELFADALDRLLSDRKLRKRMGEAGAAVAANFFPVQRTVQSVGQLYRAVVQHSARRNARRYRAMRKLGVDLSKVRKRIDARKQRRNEDPFPWQRAGMAFDERLAPGAPVEDALTYRPPSPPARPRGRTAARRSRPLPPPPRHPNRVAPQTELPEIDFPEIEDFSFDDDGLPRAPRPTIASRTRGRAALAARVDVAEALDERPLPRPRTAPVLEPTPAPPARPVEEDIFAPKPVYDALKRAIDLALAAFILIAGAPLWILVAIAIKLESPGPVFFRGTVVGKDCKPFTYYKFRSMRIDGDDRAHRRFIEKYVRENGGLEVDGEIVYKLLGDDRITAVGRWIRKFSIDEIPQILNVLRGDMSFVGPRPPLDYEYELYDDQMKQRLRVLPGITGMQQVWSRHLASFEDKLRMDMNYIRQRSLWLDIKLILHTILAIPRGN